MNMFNLSGLSRPFTISLFFHGVLLSILLFSIDLTTPRSFSSQKSPTVAPKIIQATNIDQNQIEQEVHRLQAERLAEENAQKHVLEAAKQAQQRRRAEQARVERLRKQLKQTQAQQQAELAKAKQELEQLKQQQEELKRKQAAEQQRLKQLKQQNAKLTKQQEAAKKKSSANKQQTKPAVTKTDKSQTASNSVAQKIDTSEITKYSNLIQQAIRQQWIIPDKFSQDLSCQLNIRLAPDGTVLSVRITRSSGNSALDRSALNAVYKASPLPVPSKPELFAKFRELNLIVKPEQVVS
ncbi:MAG: cell envelope integrity protein TolA [Gammaproteobacteria bacterium]